MGIFYEIRKKNPIPRKVVYFAKNNLTDYRSYR